MRAERKKEGGPCREGVMAEVEKGEIYLKNLARGGVKMCLKYSPIIIYWFLVFS